MKVKNKVKLLAMEKLGAILKETFADLSYLDVSGDNEYFYMEFDATTKHLARKIRKLDGLVKPYIAHHGDPKLSYVFNINKGRELVNIIRYNEKEYGHKITVDLAGQQQSLFIVDLLGIGDYSVFNKDFETLGLIYRPIRMPAAGQYRMSKLEAFADPQGWTTSSQLLKPYLTKIVNGVYIQLKLEDELETTSFLADGEISVN